MSLTPTVPQIAPVQSAAGGLATPQDIGDLLGPIATRANASLPDPYTQGTQVAEPHYHERAPQQTNRPTNTAPITGQVADVKRARRQNAVAGLANTISMAGNAIQEKKNNKLKDQLTDVMKAKQNIVNATAVMQNPASSDTLKQQAQKVLDANKKQLNTILSDPKTTKQMQKALDISFVDPEKNKTPEVQTYQAAMKEFKEAGPFNADNPQEHAVAQAAKAPQMTDARQPPLPPPAPNLQPVPKSQTPYADKALAKDLPSIEVNPLYAPALKQQQDAQKQLATIVPKLIDAQMKATVQAAKDGNAAARAQFSATVNLIKQSSDIIAKSKLQEGKDKAAMSRTAANNAARLKDTTLRVNAALEIAKNKNLTKEQSDSIKSNSLETLGKEINVATTTLNKAEDELAKATAGKADSGVIESLKIQRDLAVINVSTLNKLREEKFSDAPNVQAQGVLNDNNGSSTKVESVGNSDSDEPEDDSDDYGNS